MNESTKILTVSYGTFSCTLEGFDDPLGAMRDIAEYFRDLAADDRYFGAEPPTPDVEMLQNIAQKEVNRRVDARLSETGVALRQVEVTEEVETEKPEPQVDETTEAMAADPAAEVETPVESEADDTADMTARVISAVTSGEPAPETPAPSEAEADTGPLAFDDDYLLSDEPEDVLAVDPGAQPTAEGPAETVAEKLRRIRAVVSRNVEEARENRPFSEPQAPSAERPLRDRALTRTIEEISADLQDDEDQALVAPADEPQADVPEQIAAPASEVSEPQDAADTFADIQDPAAADTDDQANDDDQVDPDDAVSAFSDTSDQDDTFEEEDASAFDGDADDGAPEEILAAEAPAEVETVEGEDTGWSFDDDDAFDADDEDDEDEDVIKRSVSDILGKVSGRVLDEETGDEPAEVQEQDAAPTDTSEPLTLDSPLPDDKPARVVSRSLSPEPEGDVGRLMAETDNKLKDDEVVRRRRVISQMRAAVAATRADRMVTRQVPKEEAEEREKSQYREDLSEAVRPSVAKSAAEPRPVSTVPPLVLVSSQRVDDEPDTTEQKPLRSEVSTPRHEGGFAAFAKSVGATELSELLEAAAAYAVFNDGQPSFTRPEIMKRVAGVDPSTRMSREDSLRSFGQLLRQGKFKKLERGQFTITEDTRFNPEHRFAGE